MGQSHICKPHVEETAKHGQEKNEQRKGPFCEPQTEPEELLQLLSVAPGGADNGQGTPGVALHPLATSETWMSRPPAQQLQRSVPQ